MRSQRDALQNHRLRIAVTVTGLAALAGCTSNADTRLADFDAQREAIARTSSTPVETTPATTTAPPPVESSTTSTSTTEPEPEPDTTEVALPIGLERTLESGGSFRYSFDSVADLPELPTEIFGYVAYEGEDAYGLSGLIRTSGVRVFEAVPEMIPIPNFSGQTNSCNDAYWVLRWVSTSPNVRIQATNELGAWIGPEGEIEDEPWLLPPAGIAGLMGNNICYAPAFRFDSNIQPGGNLIDVAVEWIYFDRDPFAPTDANSNPPTTSCIDYSYDDELPISVCSQGFSVELFQEALGIDADGYFGPGTEAAVRAYQESVGLPANGVMDATTWASLGVTIAAPFTDLNGDGVIDGSEFPGT